jgi:serine/threonine protein kinase
VKTTGEDDDEDTPDNGRLYFSSKAGKKVSTDDFTIVRVIGKGSFGKVMEVRKKDTNEVFAMKEMSKEVIERENLLEHIFAEKSILQKIDHPFVVQLHYAFQTKDKLYLVLDFLSGGELFFHLSKEAKFDEWRAKFYTAEIGLALGHLHDLDIIYRDLKPENAVLDREGHVCLTDFGLAKTNVQGAYAASTFCGTPEYLAPEFLMGTGHGKAVDWWSLGILLYEMLCGIPPFYSESVNEMYDLILKKPLEFTEEVSAAARDLCTKLLDRNPETRLKDIKTFMAHPFFSDINWETLYKRKIPAPFKPDTDAVNNFDPEFTSLQPRLSVASNAQPHVQIAGFTFEGKQSDLQ